MSTDPEAAQMTEHDTYSDNICTTVQTVEEAGNLTKFGQGFVRWRLQSVYTFQCLQEGYSINQNM